VLKGALLMLAWLGETIRPTRDVDLLGFGEVSEQSLAQIVADVCNTDVELDGLEYLPASIRVAPIRRDDVYGGLRAILQARLGKARLRVQIDVGIGDAVTPPPEWLDYPSMLELPRPRLRAYRPETAIAEKLHAMVVLGEAKQPHARLLRHPCPGPAGPLRRRFLAGAIRATFERRRTPLPESLPLALTSEFAAIRDKQTQWQGFLRKNALTAPPTELGTVVARIATFLEPAITAARSDIPLKLAWTPGGPWRLAS